MTMTFKQYPAYDDEPIMHLCTDHAFAARGGVRFVVVAETECELCDDIPRPRP